MHNVLYAVDAEVIAEKAVPNLFKQIEYSAKLGARSLTTWVTLENMNLLSHLGYQIETLEFGHIGDTNYCVVRW